VNHYSDIGLHIGLCNTHVYNPFILFHLLISEDSFIGLCDSKEITNFNVFF
jgi:hypothetical protein